MLKRSLVALLVLVGFSSCEGGWSDEYKDQFLQSCKEGGNLSGMSAAQKEKNCQCTLDVVMKHYKTIAEVVENKDSTQVSAEVEVCKMNALSQ